MYDEKAIVDVTTYLPLRPLVAFLVSLRTTAVPQVERAAMAQQREGGGAAAVRSMLQRARSSFQNPQLSLQEDPRTSST